MGDINPEDDHRRGQRRRVLLKGTIIRGINHSETVCLVRNMSETGAQLKVGIDQHVPEEFLLALPHGGIAYRCRQTWRSETNIGVVFLGTEAIPHWHYG